MGFMSNTVSLVQFRVVQPSEGDRFKPEYIAEALTRHAFKSISETADEKSVGWVSLHDPSVTTFADSGMFCVGHHIGFSLRVDQRKVPAAVLRERCKLAEEEFLRENPGYTKVPKVKRMDIQEAQRTVLLAQLIPVPTVYDAVWDLSTNIITFCNLSQKAMDLFYDMFKKTFEDAGLRYITPYDRAMAVLVGPVTYAPYRDNLPGLLTQANKAGSDFVLELLKENEWIGHDFLLWLLHHEQGGGFVRPEVTAYIDQKLLLAGAGENGPEKIVFTGGNSKLSAIKAALSSGKQITVARIFMEAEEQTWAFTLRGANFEFAQFKCPPVRLEKEDTTDELMERQAVFLERIALIDKGRELFSQVFVAFLQDRLISIEWSVRQADIAAWQGGEA